MLGFVRATLVSAALSEHSQFISIERKKMKRYDKKKDKMENTITNIIDSIDSIDSIGSK